MAISRYRRLSRITLGLTEVSPRRNRTRICLSPWNFRLRRPHVSLMACLCAGVSAREWTKTKRNASRTAESSGSPEHNQDGFIRNWKSVWLDPGIILSPVSMDATLATDSSFFNRFFVLQLTAGPLPASLYDVTLLTRNVKLEQRTEIKIKSAGFVLDISATVVCCCFSLWTPFTSSCQFAKHLLCHTFALPAPAVSPSAYGIVLQLVICRGTRPLPKVAVEMQCQSTVQSDTAESLPWL